MGGMVGKAFAVLRIGGVQIDAMADTVCGAIRCSGYHHSTIGMADNDRVVEVFRVQQLHDVIDLEIEVDLGAHVLGILAHAGQGWRIDGMPFRLQPPCDWLVTPATMTSAVNEYEYRHACSPVAFVIN